MNIAAKIEARHSPDWDRWKSRHARVAHWEGGLIDDPKDPGGITKWGVSLRFAVSAMLDFNKDGRVDRKDILVMTKEQADHTYYVHFWRDGQCHQLPDGVDQIHYDGCVNQGKGRSARFLQQAAGVKADGIIGPITLGAVRSMDPHELIDEYAARRTRHYSSLSLVVRFGLGWFRRLFNIARTAHDFV